MFLHTTRIKSKIHKLNQTGDLCFFWCFPGSTAFFFDKKMGFSKRSLWKGHGSRHFSEMTPYMDLILLYVFFFGGGRVGGGR